MSKPCILIVEDNAADVQLFELTLQDCGLECDLKVIRDGAEALRWVGSREELPDLVVLDLNLPKYDGFDILTRMRASPEFEAIPVMVLSSSVSPRDVARVEAFPNTKYFAKPVDLDEYAAIGAAVRAMIRER